MKSTARRRLALKKLTVSKLAAARGGYFYSNDARCSQSCNTCQWICGFVLTDQCDGLSQVSTCYYC